MDRIQRLQQATEEQLEQLRQSQIHEIRLAQEKAICSLDKAKTKEEIERITKKFYMQVNDIDKAYQERIEKVNNDFVKQLTGI